MTEERTASPVGLTTDGHTTIRAPLPGDAASLIAGRDTQFHFFMGKGCIDPRPSACIIADSHIIGWIDYDPEPKWLESGEVNIGYNLFAPYRHRGHASRAVQLLTHHLALDGMHDTAVLLIRKDNKTSLALAERLGFTHRGVEGESIRFKRTLPSLTYSDGIVTIRRRQSTDLDEDLAAKDSEQQRWLWLPEERQQWALMSHEARRAHALKHLISNHDTFGYGPKWTFSVDAQDGENVAYVDCDLANDNLTQNGVGYGEANISYASHPAHRGKGYVTRSVRLLIHFLAEHTGARSAHLVISPGNHASLRVAQGINALFVSRFKGEEGQKLLHYKVTIDRSKGVRRP